MVYTVKLIPILGGIIGFGLGIYSLVLHVFSIMAVHRLSGGKATAVVLLPLFIVLTLVCLFVAVIFAVIAAAASQTH